MRRTVCLILVMFFLLNGCASVQLYYRIRDAKNEKIVLSEYKSAVLINDTLYIEYVGCNKSKYSSESNQSLIAEYNLKEIEKKPKEIPKILNNLPVAENAGINVPLQYIDIKNINISKRYNYDNEDLYNEDLYKAVRGSIDFSVSKMPCVCIAYEEEKSKEGNVYRVPNASNLLYVFQDQSKNVKYMLLATPEINISSQFKVYSLNSLWPIAIVLDIPVAIFFVLIVAAGGYKG